MVKYFFHIFLSIAYDCMPQSFTFFTDPCFSSRPTFQAKFPSSLTSLSLALLSHSGQIPVSQHQTVPANPSPSQRHSQPLWLVTQPSLTTSQSHQPPPVTPSLPILVNHPNQKALITAAGFPRATCQRESDRDGKNSAIVPQRLVGSLLWSGLF